MVASLLENSCLEDFEVLPADQLVNNHSNISSKKSFQADVNSDDMLVKYFFHKLHTKWLVHFLILSA